MHRLSDDERCTCDNLCPETSALKLEMIVVLHVLNKNSIEF